jgi:hypothetical protein
MMKKSLILLLPFFISFAIASVSLADKHVVVHADQVYGTADQEKGVDPSNSSSSTKVAEPPPVVERTKVVNPSSIGTPSVGAPPEAKYDRLNQDSNGTTGDAIEANTPTNSAAYIKFDGVTDSSSGASGAIEANTPTNSAAYIKFDGVTDSSSGASGAIEANTPTNSAAYIKFDGVTDSSSGSGDAVNSNGSTAPDWLTPREGGEGEEGQDQWSRTNDRVKGMSREDLIRWTVYGGGKGNEEDHEEENIGDDILKELENMNEDERRVFELMMATGVNPLALIDFSTRSAEDQQLHEEERHHNSEMLREVMTIGRFSADDDFGFNLGGLEAFQDLFEGVREGLESGKNIKLRSAMMDAEKLANIGAVAIARSAEEGASDQSEIALEMAALNIDKSSPKIYAVATVGEWKLNEEQLAKTAAITDGTSNTILDGTSNTMKMVAIVDLRDEGKTIHLILQRGNQRWLIVEDQIIPITKEQMLCMFGSCG